MAVTSESRALQHRLCGLGLTLVFIGGAGVGGLMVAQRRIAQTSQWPSVTGKIVTSEVVTGTVKNGRTLIVSPHDPERDQRGEERDGGGLEGEERQERPREVHEVEQPHRHQRHVLWRPCC